MKNFLVKNRWKALLSSVLVLLPMAAGLLLWDRLPNSMTVHWGGDGTADGWGTKAFAVFGLPLILLALHWFCLLFTARDPGNRGQHPKAMGLIFWIIPALSLGTCAMVYSAALGRDVNTGYFTVLVIAVIFLVFGNYLPKIKQNSTLGIKMTWTLRDEENWNATHRFGGKLWVAGGLALLAAMLLPEKLLLPALVVIPLVMVAAPILYSWRFECRRRKEGVRELRPVPKNKNTRIAAISGTIIGVAVLALVIVLMFTGSIGYEVGEDSFHIEASYYADLTVGYAEIDSMELREGGVPGSRTNGFGSPVLSMGIFRNEEFGLYTRYTYTGADVCIIIRGGEQVLVISGKTDGETMGLYEALEEAVYR